MLRATTCLANRLTFLPKATCAINININATPLLVNYSTIAMATATAPISAPAATLPPLSKEDFKTFNLLAEIMDKHHNHFRSQWNILWETATTGRRPQGMTVKQLVKSGLEFAEYLSVHHDMEEKRMFPMLGNRIKEFDPRNGELHLQHEEIHKGLSQLEAYLKTVKKDENEFDVATLKSKMEGWAEVLWAHLDDEVRALGAENMRQHFTKEEMQKMRW